MKSSSLSLSLPPRPPPTPPPSRNDGLATPRFKVHGRGPLQYHNNYVYYYYHSTRMTQHYSGISLTAGINTGGAWDFPPPDLHSPLPETCQALYWYIIIVECDKILFVYVISEATRNSHRGCKFQKFSGGVCPQIPLVWVWCRAWEFPPSTKNFCTCINPWTDTPQRQTQWTILLLFWMSIIDFNAPLNSGNTRSCYSVQWTLIMCPIWVCTIVVNDLTQGKVSVTTCTCVYKGKGHMQCTIYMYIML
jgi:hypothetical protein